MDFEKRLKAEIETAKKDLEAAKLWDLFESATPEQQVIVFRRTLQAGVLDDEYAFEFLNAIKKDCDPSKPEDRAFYTHLLNQLQKQAPEVYQQSSAYYHRDLINFAIIENRWQDLSRLLSPYTSGDELDIFLLVIAQLKYHSQLEPSIEAMKKAWPNIKDSTQYIEGTDEEFAWTLMELMLADYLESTSDPKPDDPALLEPTAFLLPWDEEWLTWFITTVTQSEPSEWNAASFSANMGSEAWTRQLNSLLLEFVANRWRAGFPLSRGLMAWHKFSEILHAQSKASRRKQKRKEAWPADLSVQVIPQADLMDRILGESFSIFGGEPYEVTATLELVPAYLEFLQNLGLVQSSERQQALRKIKPIVDQMPQIVKYYGGDPVAVENLLDAWAIGDRFNE
jgi:hypothetical protein